jgi:protein-S-isoprenylcysteine O-methyltransferase Ste14
MRSVGIEVGERGELHMLPAIAWAASFGLCALGDVMLGRWTLLPLFVVSFYGGMFIIALVTYPMLSFWRSWLKRRGLFAWYLMEVGGLWGGTTLVLILLSVWWLRWSWSGTSSLQVLGCVLFVGSVVAGTWALAKMGWARLLLAGALFPSGAGAEENGVPQRMVVEGPYRYVRNPLYDGDFCLIVGAALLTRSWALVLVAAFYLAQLALQLPLEERELRERFGAPYRRYCELVPRFVPRRRPVQQRDLHT